MRWSVLLPTSTRLDLLTLAIRSVLSQDDGDLELLIVGTADVAIDDPRVHWFDVPGEEAAGVRTALAAASGRHLAFASATALWGPAHLTQLGRMLDSGLAAASTRPTALLSSGRVVPMPFDLRDRATLERFEAGEKLTPAFLALSMAAVNAAGGWPSDDAAHHTLLRRVLAGRRAGIGYVSSTTALRFVAGELPAEVDRTWLDAATVVGGTPESVVTAAGARPERWWASLDEAVGTIESRLAGQSLELRRSNAELGAELATAQARIAELEAAYREVPSWRVPTRLRETFDK